MTLYEEFREFEFLCLLNFYGKPISKKRILEIGSSRGDLLFKIRNMGVDITGVEIEENETTAKLQGIVYYDGKRLPFNDNSFDIILSSNVLEHIDNLNEFELEIRRVLRPDAVVLHVLPTHMWRFWTMLIHYFALPRRIVFRMSRFNAKVTNTAAKDMLKKTNYTTIREVFHLLSAALVYPRHGVRGNRFTELYYFHPTWWKRHFVQSGYKKVEVLTIPLFYTDHTLLPWLTLKHRKLLSFLGSATACYKMEK